MRRIGLAILLILAAVSIAHGGDQPREKHEYKKKTVIDFSDVTLSGELAVPSGAYIQNQMSATVGGAQNVSYFRAGVARGLVPRPETLTPEGLFSEHDLLLARKTPCQQLLCVHGQTAPVQLITEKDVHYLAQLGFSSGLNPRTFRRSPLNLVAVVDRSGSMRGQSLELVKETLRSILSQLGPRDRLSIVTFGDAATVHLRPTAVRTRNRIRIEHAISRIESHGSTYLEDGLKAGIHLARRTRRFDGVTRVMLFTDEQPNVGRTDAEGFMSQARAASKRGIGMTTIGVGVKFGAELAQQVSSVRGGNLFYFPNPTEMKRAVGERFDTMVTELAYDLDLQASPAPGFRITGVYGLPNDRLEWEEDSVRLKVETLFLSKKRGAIFFGLSSVADAPGSSPWIEVRLTYREIGGARRSAVAQLHQTERSPSLRRGAMLVNQATAMKRAATLVHHEQRPEEAHVILEQLAKAYQEVSDPTLAKERKMVLGLRDTLAKMTGRSREPIARY